MDAITVYTKPGCVQCNAVFRALDKLISAWTLSSGTFVLAGPSIEFYCYPSCCK
jgi:glutaredoxin-like protein NrdH